MEYFSFFGKCRSKTIVVDGGLRYKYRPIRKLVEYFKSGNDKSNLELIVNHLVYVEKCREKSIIDDDEK